MNKKFDIAGFGKGIFGVKFNNENEFFDFLEKYDFDVIRFCNKKIFPQYADFSNYSSNVVLVDNYKVNLNYVNWSDYMEENKKDKNIKKYSFDWNNFFLSNIAVCFDNADELIDFMENISLEHKIEDGSIIKCNLKNSININKYIDLLDFASKYYYGKVFIYYKYPDIIGYDFCYENLKKSKKIVFWENSMNNKKEKIDINKNNRKNKLEVFKSITDKMHKTYEAKNNDYGDSFTKVRNKYPNSIVIRLNDKLNRLESLMNGNKQMVSGESIKDTLIDMANYCIMELIEMEMENERREKV